jgi:esterase/lipase superfamily enzyme
VSIPATHKRGVFDKERWTHLEFAPDLDSHIVLLHVSDIPKEKFFSSLRTRVAGKREVMLFIHGYRVPFSVAVRRTAQLAYDIGFDGVPILYSWPSYGGYTNYAGDEGNAAWTSPDLQQFLEDLARTSGATAIHVIAHSMGNRPLVEALTRIAAARKPVHFADLVFTAPDVDADIMRRSMPAMRPLAGRITLYASSKDKALQASRVVHSDQPRAGEAGEHLLVMPGVDTIDASALETGFFALGHNYTASNSLALTDLGKLIRDHMPPPRPGLARLAAQAGIFWRYVVNVTQP